MNEKKRHTAWDKSTVLFFMPHIENLKKGAKQKCGTK